MSSSGWFTSALTTIGQQHPELAPVVTKHLTQMRVGTMNSIAPYQRNRQDSHFSTPTPPANTAMPAPAPLAQVMQPQQARPQVQPQTMVRPISGTIGNSPVNGAQQMPPMAVPPRMYGGAVPMTNGGIAGGTQWDPRRQPIGQLETDNGDPNLAAPSPMPRNQMPMANGGTVRLRSQDGEEADVPAHQVDYFLKKGAQRVSGSMGGQ